MGCDFFYSGNLLDFRLQEKVIDFVQSYYSEIDLVVYPQPGFGYVLEFDELFCFTAHHF